MEYQERDFIGYLNTYHITVTQWKIGGLKQIFVYCTKKIEDD